MATFVNLETILRFYFENRKQVNYFEPRQTFDLTDTEWILVNSCNKLMKMDPDKPCCTDYLQAPCACQLCLSNY